MKITGAVLEESGRPRPYARSRPVSVLELDLDLGVGQQVVMSFLPRCGSCPSCDTDGRLPCTPGTASNTSGELLTGGRRLHRGGQPVHHHLGVSALADHAVIDRRSLVPVEDDVPPRVAAVLGCAVLTGGGAVIDAGKPQDGDTVLVVGLGGVRVAALITAVSLGRGKVIGIDAVPEELEQALALGADEVHGPPEALEAGIRAPVGSAVPARDIPVFAHLWREGRLPVESLISSTVALTDIDSAMDTLSDGGAVRQVILFEKDTPR